MATIPEYATTSLDDITTAANTIHTSFRSNKTKDVQFRLRQIRKLYWGIVNNEKLIEAALRKDMRKCKHEAVLTEIAWIKAECLDFTKNLEKWVEEESIINVPMQYLAMKPRIRNEPLGKVLIIGAYNFPFQLNITPLIGAIAAGNTVVLKPSELSPHSAMVIKKIFDEALDPECYICVNGKVDETKHILEHKFDKIVFTGGKRTGTIIAKKAAETLTPCLLELGGQNPAFVTKNGDVKLAARRLLWNKTLNAGQVCLSQNYVLIERSVLSTFIGELNNQYRTMMPKGAKASPDYSRLPNKHHFDRLKAMLDNSKGKIVMGGKMDEADLFIEPTVVLVDDVDDSMMVEESFGPIWSIFPVDSLDQAIGIAHKIDPTPLSLFTFGSDAENEKVLLNVTSGGATVNDGYFHAQFNASPLGGIGSSGQGSYHGYYSLKAFSHQRPIARVPKWTEKVLRVRYMPYLPKELAFFQLISLGKPNFDRNGNVIKGLGYWFRFVLGLGGKSATGSLMRWILVGAIATFAHKRRQLN